MPGTTGSESSSTAAEICPEDVRGGLLIDENTDLSQVGGVTWVMGYMDIEQVMAPDLSFLRCLRTVESLKIFFNSEIQSLEGLGRLEEIGNYLLVEQNSKLRSLEGLSSLRHASTIVVQRSRALTTLGLDQLETAESIRIGGCVLDGPEGGNSGLTDITGLSGLKSIDILTINGNENLTSLDGLRVLAENNTHIGALTVRHNYALPTEHIEEIVELLAPDEAFFCANEGDELWMNPDNPDPEYCICGPPSE